MKTNSNIYVAGHQGLVGSAIYRQLAQHGYYNLVTRMRNGLNLLDQSAVCHFMQQEKPEYVFIGAKKSGGYFCQ